MSNRIPSVTGREAINAFCNIGLEETRTSGSHHILKRPYHPKLLTVPVHGSTPLKTGLLKGLIHAAGITVDEFIKALN